MAKEIIKDNNIEAAQLRFEEIMCYCKMLNEAPGAEESMPEGMPDEGMPQGDAMPPMDNGQGMPGPEPMPENGNGVPEFQPEGEMPQGGTNPSPAPEENVEEIDVDDLTDAQEDTEKRVKHVSKKIEGLDEKLSQLLDMIDKFQSDVDTTNKNIEDLRQEFEKRNPTNVEKLTLRSKKAYPDGESPQEYWDKKESEGVYSTEDDKNGENDEKYKITKSDVDKITNWNDIYNSIERSQYSQNLQSILGY